MTRIIAGEWGGRRLVVPGDARVRPTADRVREAWMSIVGPALEDASVVDLFAGSGALGLEAVSRGARQATLVEINPLSIAAIGTNVEALEAGARVTVVRQDVFRFLKTVQHESYDVGFADPPYGLGLAERLALAFREQPFARILGVEHRSSETLPFGETRTYGDTAVTFLYPT